MNEIKEKNLLLVKNDVEELAGIISALIKHNEAYTIILGINCYLILIAVEILNYIENNLNIIITYKYKNYFKSTRARIKPYENSYEEMLSKITELNKKKFEYYSNLCDPITKEIAPTLIDNIGITFLDGIIIDNTFLDELDNKKIILSNGEYDSSKVLAVSKELGLLIKKILNSINCTSRNVSLNINKNVSSKDFNVFFQQNILFNNDLEVNISLLLLNILCSLNYYKFLISDFDISNSLKYRIAYIIYNRTFNNLDKIVEANKLHSIKTVLDKYANLNNQSFRNKMFHYDMYKVIDNNNYKKNSVYLGLVEKYFNISEDDFMKQIDNYFNELPLIVERTIF